MESRHTSGSLWRVHRCLPARSLTMPVELSRWRSSQHPWTLQPGQTDTTPSAFKVRKAGRAEQRGWQCKGPPLGQRNTRPHYRHRGMHPQRRVHATAGQPGALSYSENVSGGLPFLSHTLSHPFEVNLKCQIERHLGIQKKKEKTKRKNLKENVTRKGRCRSLECVGGRLAH